MSLWHWVGGAVALLLLCGTRGAVRGGIIILLLTLLTARLLYVWVTP